jgi:hypothetical protein
MVSGDVSDFFLTQVVMLVMRYIGLQLEYQRDRGSLELAYIIGRKLLSTQVIEINGVIKTISICIIGYEMFVKPNLIDNYFFLFLFLKYSLRTIIETNFLITIKIYLSGWFFSTTIFHTHRLEIES